MLLQGVIADIPNFFDYDDFGNKSSDRLANDDIILDNPDIMIIKTKDKNRKLIYDEKLELAEKYIWERLNKLGIYHYNNDLLISRSCTEKEARKVFCESEDYHNLPIVRFKKIWYILKEKELADNYYVYRNSMHNKKDKQDEQENIIRAVNSEKIKQFINDRLMIAEDVIEIVKNIVDMVAEERPIGQLSDEELLNKYISKNNLREVCEELGKRSNYKPFIAYDNEKEEIINSGISLEMLKEARKNTKIGGWLTRHNYTYKLYIPSMDQTTLISDYYDMCPIHNIILNRGYCDECEFDWTRVPDADKTLIFTIYNYYKDTISDKNKLVHYILELRSANRLLVKFKHGYDKFVNEFPPDLEKYPTFKIRKSTKIPLLQKEKS